MKFARNLTKYMSKQQIWTLSLLLGLFTCHKLANLSWNVVTATNKQQSKTATSQWPLCKNWPRFKTLCHWHIKRANDDLCYWKEPSGQTNSKLTSTLLSWRVRQPKQVAQFFRKIAIMLEKYYYKNCLKDCLVKTWHSHCLVQCIEKQKLGHNYSTYFHDSK